MLYSDFLADMPILTSTYILGRGPSQSSTSDGTVSDSGTFKGPATGKGVKKKLKPSSPSLNTTRSKTADTPRKRLSSEGDATTSKRHTRKRGG